MLFDALAKVSTAAIETGDRDRVHTIYDDFNFGRSTWIGRGVRRDVLFVVLQLAPAASVSRIRRFRPT